MKPLDSKLIHGFTALIPLQTVKLSHVLSGKNTQNTLSKIPCLPAKLYFRTNKLNIASLRMCVNIAVRIANECSDTGAVRIATSFLFLQ